ncbi:MAG: MFS transporter [Cohaesibacter sp.]|nr:MFS transporter [Cohaesibacter sp.]
MLQILKHRQFLPLFVAQLVALFGTGLATVALGLLAFDLAGKEAGLVLGLVFTIKMVAYVGIAPIAAAFADRVPRRKMLVMLDLVRAGVALLLPFVSDVWQIFALIFFLQAASAAFTPTFQASLPDILPDEEEYTKALSLSRLAYDLESLLTPMMAGFVLLMFAYQALFVGTIFGFVASALLILSVALPNPKVSKPRGIYERTTRGVWIYLATPRLRGLLALCMIVSAIGSMVLVNNVVLVRDVLGLQDVHVAYSYAAFGAGSMVAALSLPRLLERLADRQLMMAGAGLLIVAHAVLLAVMLSGLFSFGALLLGWFFVGIGYSTILTPSGRLLQRSSHAEDRPAIYAAQFALSHACWLLCYPLAGWLQTAFGSEVTMAALTFLGLLSALTAWRLWPSGSERVIEHSHEDLPADHPHLKDSHGMVHSHVFVVDDYHAHWPTRS